MASLPRILVADNQRDISRALRSTLDLLDHPAVVVEVPTAGDALLEVQRAPCDLLVSAYELPGMNGLELAERAAAEAPGMKAIVIAGAESRAPDEERLRGASCTFLVRPLAADRFAGALRMALGEGTPEPTAPPAEDLGPVPEVHLGELRSILSALLTDVGAMAIVLVDRNGELLIEQGAVGYLDRGRLTSVLAPTFALMAHIAEIVGGDPRGMHFWDGEEFDIYGLSVGLHHFVCLAFEGSAGNRALGSVSIYGRRAIDEMLKVIGPAAFEVRKAKPAAPSPLVRKPAAARPAPSPVAEPRRPGQPEREPPRPPPVVEVDDAALEDALGKVQSADVDAFWESVGQGEESLSREVGGDEGALSFEEALQLGLLPPDLGRED
jgi:CheY-like chemotaxis protein